MSEVKIFVGNICDFWGDVIVNAANSVMLGGGGVDGAIHRAAGAGLRAACASVPTRSEPGLGPGGIRHEETRCRVGQVIPTPGFDLNAKWVFHTVAPVYDLNHVEYAPSNLSEADAKDRLRRQMAACFRRCMELAEAMCLRTIAFPALGCGAYQWTHEQVAEIAMRQFRENMGTELTITVYLQPGNSDLPAWEDAARKYGFGGSDLNSTE